MAGIEERAIGGGGRGKVADGGSGGCVLGEGGRVDGCRGPARGREKNLFPDSIQSGSGFIPMDSHPSKLAASPLIPLRHHVKIHEH